MEDLFNKLPGHVEKIMNATTNLGARFDAAIGGGGGTEAEKMVGGMWYQGHELSQQEEEEMNKKRDDALASIDMQMKARERRNLQAAKKAREDMEKQARENRQYVQDSRAERERKREYYNKLEAFLSVYGYPEYEGQTMEEFLKKMENHGRFVIQNGNSFRFLNQNENLMDVLNKYTPFKIINDIGSKVLSTVGVEVDVNDIANKIVGLSDQGPSGEQLAAEEEVLQSYGLGKPSKLSRNNSIKSKSICSCGCPCCGSNAVSKKSTGRKIEYLGSGYNPKLFH
jgi:hypothetical protein